MRQVLLCALLTIFCIRRAKLARGLRTTTEGGVAPRMLRSLCARGNAEFASSRQQDALDWFQHYFELLEAAEARSHASPVRLSACSRCVMTSSRACAAQSVAQQFRFGVEERTECSQSHCVAYQTTVRRRSSVIACGVRVCR